jgi:hypothetical protein
MSGTVRHQSSGKGEEKMWAIVRIGISHGFYRLQMELTHVMSVSWTMDDDSMISGYRKQERDLDAKQSIIFVTY